MILEVYAIWVNSNNDFGIFFRPIIASFTPKEEQYNYRFIESEDECDGDIDIPDTEVNNNLFIPNINQMNENNDSTSQIDINNMINSNIVNINLSESNFSSSSSSESDKERTIDAETSDEE